MLITTTNSIENARVEKYLGVVTTNLVIGTGFFTDFTAAFSDFFGGMSGAYREQMDELYSKAYDALTRKASIMGANAILGYKIDFDEISGKGKQMFMVSVSGTAVVLINDSDTQVIYADEHVSYTRLNIELFKQKWQARNKSVTPTRAELDFIMEHGLIELAPSLFEYYTDFDVIYDPDNEDKPIFSIFPLLLSTLTYDEAVAFIYNDYINNFKRSYNLISKYKLFNGAHVLRVLQEDIRLGIELLELEKKEYTRQDLEQMKAILNYLDNLPDQGKIEMTKSGMFSSKMEEMYICPLGHKNARDVEFCQGELGTCELNIKGLKPTQVQDIETFKNRVNILEKLFK